MKTLVMGMVVVMGASLGGVSARTLTADGSDRYVAASAAASLQVSAPSSNVGSNLRRVYWPSGQADRGDGTVYATWTSRSAESVQEGLAHHVTATRAVTVTKNVWAAAYWAFNVHTWSGETFVQVAQFDMVDVMFAPGGGYQPLPWRVASRMVGDVLTFKIWFPAAGMVEPSWSDAAYARQATIPAGWTAPGKTGWYAGHIPPGGQLTYAGLSVT